MISGAININKCCELDAIFPIFLEKSRPNAVNYNQLFFFCILQLQGFSQKSMTSGKMHKLRIVNGIGIRNKRILPAHIRREIASVCWLSWR